MKTIEIHNSLFAQNRSRLLDKMEAGSVAVVNSNFVLPTNADGTFAYRPHSDMFYLTGIGQEETTLLLVKENDGTGKAVLFIKEFDPHYEKWMGRLLTVGQACQISGIDKVLLNKEFESVFNAAVLQARAIYLNANEHPRAHLEIEDKDIKFGRRCRKKYPLHQYHRLAPMLAALRRVKSEAEVQLMQQAVNITTAGFERLLHFVKPGVWEYEIEAELLHEYYRQGSTEADYKPIIAAGADNCILHYTANSKQCLAGQLLLIDAAAGWANYNADLTRTIPVSGRYTVRQKQLYNAVLRVNKAMQQLMVPGALMAGLQEQCNELLLKELVDLQLAPKEAITNAQLKRDALQTYCYHNFSHLLGLDVHDVGDMKQPLEAGMVLTNEPGIYIAAEGMGVRIENNILVTQSGNINLMQNTPIEAEHIEELMNANA